MSATYEPPLTAEQLAEQLGCEPEHINLLASQHKLPAVKYGRSWRFPPAAVAQFLADQALQHVANHPAPAGAAPEPVKPQRRQLPDLTRTVQVVPSTGARPGRTRAGKHNA